MRVEAIALTILLGTTLNSRLARADDPVTFQAVDFGCLLEIDARPVGRIDPERPLTVSLPRGREYLLECESHDLPVKLYARYYLFSQGDFRNGPLANDVKLLPVAVLPNAIKAAVERKLTITAITDSKNLACEGVAESSQNQWEDNSRQVAPKQERTISKGTVVNVTGAPFKHCGDTNLIEIQYNGSSDWFRNEDFVFSYENKKITLFPLSQRASCCWIN